MSLYLNYINTFNYKSFANISQQSSNIILYFNTVSDLVVFETHINDQSNTVLSNIMLRFGNILWLYILKDSISGIMLSYSMVSKYPFFTYMMSNS